jgi:hypothetical protein
VVSKEVDINFKYIDEDLDLLTVTQEWSTGGGFTAMTLLTGDGAHTLPGAPFAGAAGPSGVDYNSVWDARTDLGQGFSGNATVRTILDDGTATPVNIDQVAALVNNTTPGGSIDSVVQRLDGTSLVDMLFTGIDAESDTLSITTSFSITGPSSGFSAMTLATGDAAHTYSTPYAATPGGYQTNLVWDAKSDLALGFSGQVWFKFAIDDGTGPLDVNTNQNPIFNNTLPGVTITSITLRS